MISHSIPDEKWCDLAASYAADELLAGKLIAQDQWEFAKKIVEQQLTVLLVSNCRPSGGENSN